MNTKKIATENLKGFLQKEFRGLARREDLKPLATKEELKSLATKEDLKPLATKKDIEDLAVMTQREFHRVYERLDRIEHLILKQHESKIENLQNRMKSIEDLLAVNHKR